LNGGHCSLKYFTEFFLGPLPELFVGAVAKIVILLLLAPALLAAQPERLLCLKIWPSTPLFRQKDLTSPIIKELGCDEKVVVLNYEGDWAKVRTRFRKQGYVMRIFLESSFLERAGGSFQPKPIAVLDEVGTMLNLHREVRVLDNLRLPAPREPTFFYPNLGYYLLNDVQPDSRATLRKRLESIRDHGFFGCGRQSRDDPYVCRYLATIDFVSPPSPGTELPKDWANKLDGKVVKRMWVQCFIAVDAKGTPLPPVWDIVQPVAVQTDGNDYIVEDPSTIVMSNRSSFGHLPPRVLFNLPGCKDHPSCVSRVKNNFLDEMRLNFTREPLASRVEHEVVNSGEFCMSRRYDKSLVLGGPYYEFSIYLFHISEDNDSFHLFADIDVMVLVSPNVAGTYVEATDQELTAYTQAVDSTLTSALVNTCRKIGGVMRGPTCFVANPPV
jgi:hypothetical protein